MGLFDNLKNAAMQYVNDNKNELTKKATEVVKDKADDFLKEKGPELKDNLLDKAKGYLEINKDKITTEEGKKSVLELTELIESIQSKDHEKTELTKEEKEKLSELGDKLKEEYEKSNN